jgi:hypothetical protein
MDIDWLKQLSLQVPQPTHSSETTISRFLGFCTLSVMDRYALGNKIFQRQQQLQQLQMVSSLLAGLTFNQTESSLFRPIR